MSTIPDKPLTELEKVGLAHTCGAAIALVDFLTHTHSLSRSDILHGIELAKIKLESPHETSDT